MKERDNVMALLSNLAVEVHPTIVIETLQNAGYDIVKVEPEDEPKDDGIIAKAKRKLTR